MTGAEILWPIGKEILLEYLKNKLVKSPITRELDSISIEKGIENHIIEINKWSSQFQFIEMSGPSNIDDNTIALDFHTQPRKFRGTKNVDQIKYEEELLEGPEHYLLLGEPGSGKTTTLKRLIRKLFNSPPISDLDIYQIPLVVKLREIPKGKTLHMIIADILNIKYENVERKQTFLTKEDITATVITHIDTLVDDKPIEDVIPKVISNIGIILFFDGLDEVHSSFRSGIKDEILKLSVKTNGVKIIVSTRSGDYDTIMEGFRITEICPLTMDQIEIISKKWIEDPTDFLNSLKALPYYDIADRPLLLTQLLIIYQRYAFLPERPADIYKRIIRLLLEEWDAQRNIKRETKYSRFDNERKEDFLSDLAYHLTYIIQSKQFSEHQLIEVYNNIYKKYNLPLNEGCKVAKEIQTHNGLIISGPDNNYEFSHLSIQEYLCANYLIRSPLLLDISRYMELYHAPLAVAVSLSSRPGDWLGNLFLSKSDNRIYKESDMIAFFGRLKIERPSFEDSEILGLSILYLFEKYYSKHYNLFPKALIEFVSDVKGIFESISLALRWYFISKSELNTTEYITLIIKGNPLNPYNFKIPTKVMIPKVILVQILEKVSDFGNMAIRAGGKEIKLSKKQLYELIKDNKL